MKGRALALAASWAARNACCVPLVMPLNFMASSCGVECEVFWQSSSSVPAGGAGEEVLDVDGFDGVVGFVVEVEDVAVVAEDEDELCDGDDVLSLDAVGCDGSDSVGLSAAWAA